MGLAVDMFNNTPGVAAASTTLIGFLQPWLIELFLPREAEDNIKSAGKSLITDDFQEHMELLAAVCRRQRSAHVRADDGTRKLT